MNKRIFCILTALLLVLPSLASPSATCTHLNPDGSPNYYLEGYIEPQPGIPGFSGNVRCNICGEIVYPGQVCYIDDMYDPMNPPTDKPDPRITDAPPQYGEPQETDPDNPVNPDNPANPGQDNPARSRSVSFALSMASGFPGITRRSADAFASVSASFPLSAVCSAICQSHSAIISFAFP